MGKFVYKSTCSNKFFQGIPSKSNSLDPKKDGHFIEPKMGLFFFKSYQQATKVIISGESVRYLW